jgi:hypothetical protein
MTTIALRNSPNWNCHPRLKPQPKREKLPLQIGKATRPKDGNESPQDGVTPKAALAGKTWERYGLACWPTKPARLPVPPNKRGVLNRESRVRPCIIFAVSSGGR